MKDALDSLKPILYGSGAYLLPWCAYLELSPKLTNIWYRVNSEGVRRLNLPSFFTFLVQPFYRVEFWYPWNWDLNYFVGAGLCSLLAYLVLPGTDA